MLNFHIKLLLGLDALLLSHIEDSYKKYYPEDVMKKKKQAIEKNKKELDVCLDNIFDNFINKQELYILKEKDPQSFLCYDVFPSKRTPAREEELRYIVHHRGILPKLSA